MVDEDLVNGLMKLWIYEHYIIAKSCWTLLVHDFNHDFVSKDIQQPTNVYLRRWAGLFRSSDQGILYRPRNQLGLNLTSVTVQFERMKVIRCHLLKYSSDPDIVAVYEHRRRRLESHETRWCDTQFLEKVESMADYETKFQAAQPNDKRGLGHGLFVAHLDEHAEHRKRCVAAARKLVNEKLFAHTVSLALNGVWTKWADHSCAFDLSWRNLIWGPGPRIISFILNATMNSLPTPDMLKLLNLSDVSTCSLCGAKRCTLFHILVGCDKSLKDKRYTWRHDSVLATMLQILAPKLIRHNATKLPSKLPQPIAFVKSGDNSSQNTRERPVKCLLTKANDWQLLIDFDCRRMLFPPTIVATSERPDVVVWSESSKTVILIELTCPAEENFVDAAHRKRERYAVLCEQIRNANWTVVLRTIESGARGFVAHSFRKVFRELGLSGLEATRACKDISNVTARCSYGIWLMRKSKDWNASRELVVPNNYLSPPPTTSPAPLLTTLSKRLPSSIREWHLCPDSATKTPEL